MDGVWNHGLPELTLKTKLSKFEITGKINLQYRPFSEAIDF